MTMSLATMAAAAAAAVAVTTGTTATTTTTAAPAAAPAPAPAPAAAAAAKFDEGPLREANQLLENQKYLDAHLKITGAYDLRARDLPVGVLAAECEILRKLERPQEAKSLTDGALRDRLPWTTNFLRAPRTTPLPPEVANLTGDELKLLACAAENRAASYVREYKTLTPIERRTLRSEVTGLKNLLTKTPYDADKVEKLGLTLREQDELLQHQKFRRRLQILFSYMTWEETSEFYVARAVYKGHSVTLVPCLGAGLATSSYFYDYSAGGCYGLGKAHSQVDALSFDSGAKVEAFTGFAKALKKFSEGRAAAGLQAGVLTRALTGHVTTGESAKSSHLDLTLVGVARLNFTRTFFDFKGGILVGQTGTLWSLEFGYSL